MPWIEGVGDEVTIAIGVFAFLTVLLIAWASTGIRDIPLIRVIFVELTTRRLRRRGQGQGNNGGQTETQVRRETTHRHIAGQGAIESIVYVNTVIQENGTPESSEETSSNQTGEVTNNVTQEVESESDDHDVGTGIEHNKTENQASSSSAGSDESTSSSTAVGDIKSGGKDDSNPQNGGSVQEETDSSDITISTIEPSSLSSLESQPRHSNNETLPETELRRRRVAFFNEKRQTNSSDLCGKDSSNTDVKEESDESVTFGNHSTSDSVPETRDFQAQSVNIEDSNNTKHTDSSINSAEQTQTQPGQQTENQSETGSAAQDGRIRVRLKYLNDTQRLVKALPTETIGTFRQKHFSMELAQSKLVRFIFNGQDLRNDMSTLQSCNIMDNSVVHCLITQPRQQDTAPNNANQDDGLDIGSYMFPLFGLLLAVFWYLRFSYRQFFNVSSTLMLMGITFLFLASFISSFRRTRPNEVPE